MPKDLTQMRTEINTLLADNVTRNIAPIDTRDRHIDVVTWLDQLGVDINVTNTAGLVSIPTTQTFTSMLVRTTVDDAIFYLKALPSTNAANWIAIDAGGASVILNDGEILLNTEVAA